MWRITDLLIGDGVLRDVTVAVSLSRVFETGDLLKNQYIPVLLNSNICRIVSQA
jgi:hypothetical protein